MAWKITVDFTDDRKRLVTTMTTPALGPAVESALHKLGISQLRTGSYQITITQQD